MSTIKQTIQIGKRRYLCQTRQADNESPEQAQERLSKIATTLEAKVIAHQFNVKREQIPLIHPQGNPHHRNAQSNVLQWKTKQDKERPEKNTIHPASTHE